MQRLTRGSMLALASALAVHAWSPAGAADAMTAPTAAAADTSARPVVHEAMDRTRGVMRLRVDASCTRASGVARTVRK